MIAIFRQKNALISINLLISSKKVCTFAANMKVVRNIKNRIINFLIWLDAKLGGDSSTQSHASNWHDGDKA